MSQPSASEMQSNMEKKVKGIFGDEKLNLAKPVIK